ncbi:transposase, partial [Phaeovulum sp. W22_SRMD_FR3]
MDIYCLPEGKRARLPNKVEGHEQVAQRALKRDALVCFEATGGQEWRLWSTLDVAGIATRQLPPAQIKAFAVSRGTRGKTDRIDAELIARFMMFRPDAGRVLPHEKLRLVRALTSKPGHLIETRKRLLAQIKAHGKLGSADMFDAMNAELKDLLDRQIAELEVRIEQAMASEEQLATTVKILRSVPGIGPVTSSMLIAEMSCCRFRGHEDKIVTKELECGYDET